MRIFFKKWFIKNVPKKYAEIVGICNYFDDFEHKRLSRSERKSLERAKETGELQLQLAVFRTSLLYDNPVIYELVARKEPVGVIHVITRHDKYIMLDFGNQIRLRCPDLFWDIVENKSTIKRLY